jgi:hypothetical protein
MPDHPQRHQNVSLIRSLLRKSLGSEPNDGRESEKNDLKVLKRHLTNLSDTNIIINVLPLLLH